MNKIHLAALALMTAACGTSEPEYCPARDIKSSGTQKEQPAYGLSRAYWGKEEIVVCWTTAGDQEYKDLVRDAVTDEWDKYVDIDFVGWHDCGNVFGDVSVAFKSEQSWSFIGSESVGTRPSMVLDHTFSTWRQWCASDEETRRECIVDVALHEFGHALGLVHEHVRDDENGECWFDSGQKGDTTYGPYDRESIMNYCSSEDRPSCQDLTAVQDIYGKEND